MVFRTVGRGHPQCKNHGAWRNRGFCRNPEKYPYADIHWDDGGDSSCLLKDLYASREELQNKLKKEERKKIAEIKDSIKDAGDLVRFMYDHCVACAEEYTDWTARRAVKEIAKEMLGLKLE